MLIHEGSDRSDAFDRRLSVTLAAVAGALNAAAFHAVGFFSANMTGNVSIFSDRIASGQILVGVGFLVIILAFISGATVSSLLINTGRRRKVSGIFALSIFVESVLLALLGLSDISLPGGLRAPILIIGLSFLMGLQNAVVTRISNARVRTTHISGMATDIGIELGMLIDIALGRERPTGAAPNLSNLKLHTQTVLSFFVGGVIGVLVYRISGGVLFLIAALLLFAVALSGIASLQSRGREV